MRKTRRHSMLPKEETHPELQEFKTSFVVTIGENEKRWFGVIIQGADGKQNGFVSPNLKTALSEAYKRIRKRILFNRKFPPPEPGRIITLDQAGSSLVTPNGKNRYGR